MKTLQITDELFSELANAAEMLLEGPHDDIDYNRVVRVLARAIVASAQPAQPSEPAGEVTTESLDPSAGCRNCMRSLERPEDMPSDGGVCLGCAEIPRKATVTDFQITTKNLENEAGTQLGLENEEALTSCDRAMIEAAKRDIRDNIARATAADRATIAELQRLLGESRDKHIRLIEDCDSLKRQHEADAARVRELEDQLGRVNRENTALVENCQRWTSVVEWLWDKGACRTAADGLATDACLRELRAGDSARAELETVKAKLGWRTELLDRTLRIGVGEALKEDIRKELATDHEQPADGKAGE